MTPTCICGREMAPVVGTEGDGWLLWWTCPEHPGMSRPSTEGMPLPASMSPPEIRL